MTENDLKKYIFQNFPKENERCEWKEFKSLKNSVSGMASEDLISYISSISNMEGGHLVIGIKDETAEIVGIQMLAGYSLENIKYRILVPLK